MIIEEELYLEHYGKKGMQWGVRTAKTAGRGVKTGAQATGRGTKRAAKATGKFIKDDPKRAAFIGFGLVYAGVLIAGALGQKSVDSPGFGTKTQSVSDLINQERDHKVSSIIRTHKEGHIDKDQMNKFLNTLNKRYDQKLHDAL